MIQNCYLCEGDTMFLFPKMNLLIENGNNHYQIFVCQYYKSKLF